MGDWADMYELFGYDISRIPDSAYRHGGKQKQKNVTITFRLSKEDAEKYKKLGGAVWVKKVIRESTHD